MSGQVIKDPVGAKVAGRKRKMTVDDSIDLEVAKLLATVLTVETRYVQTDIKQRTKEWKDFKVGKISGTIAKNIMSSRLVVRTHPFCGLMLSLLCFLTVLSDPSNAKNATTLITLLSRKQPCERFLDWRLRVQSRHPCVSD